MNKPFQKLMAIVMTVALILGMTPITAMAEDAAPSITNGEITAFAELDELTATQYYGAGEKQLEELDLPDSLTATLTQDAQEDAEEDETATPATTAEQTSEIAIEVSEWQSEPEYDPDTNGTYVFTPTLDLGGYTLADGVDAPQITVEIKTLMGFAPAANSSNMSATTTLTLSTGSPVGTSGDDLYWNGSGALILNNFNYSTSAATALSVPAGTTITLADGSINTITSTYNGSGTASGIYVEGALTIQGQTLKTGKLTATGGTSTGNFSYGIYSAGDLTLKSGIVTAKGGSSPNSNGIYSLGSVIVEGAEVNAIGGETDKNYGIYLWGNVALDIRSGTVKAISQGTGNTSAGIKCDTGVSFSMTGGTVVTSATSGNAMLVDDSKVTAGLIVKGNNGSGTYNVPAVFKAGKIYEDIDAVFNAVLDAQINPPAPPFDGDGSADNPYKITSSADLATLAELVNDAIQPYADAGTCYKLTADVNLGVSPYNDGTGWTPIGDNSPVANTPFFSSFKGIFDGNGKTISGLTINNPTVNNIGLFGIVNGATIKNLNLTGVSVSGKDNVGGVVGNVSGQNNTVSKCSVAGSVTGTGNNIGGVVGTVSNHTGNLIENCSSTATVSGSGNNIGGVVGGMGGGTIKNCFATGAVTGTGNNIGGVVGVGGGTIENCYATGAVSGGVAIGGVLGQNNGTMKNCYATGAVSGGTAIGGVLGQNNGTIKNCVGLNSSVTASDPTPTGAPAGYYAGRVVGFPATYSGLYGLDTMTPAGWANTGLTAQDGADVTDATARTVAFWTTAANWDTTAWNTAIWDITAGKYPVFKGSGSGSGGTTYTVTYNANGATSGTVPTDSTAYASGETVTVLGNTGTLAKTGYAFTGWNTAANGNGTQRAAGSTFNISANTTLYAKWTPTYTVSGTVKDYLNADVIGATVKIMLGTTPIGTTVTTIGNGNFSIADIPSGLYNLVIENGGQKITVVVTVTSANVIVPLTSTTLPRYIQNSEVEVRPAAPVEAVVGGLQEVYNNTVADDNKGFTEADITAIEGGATGEIKVVVDDVKATAAADQTAIENAASASGKTVDLFLDLSVFKTITPSGGGSGTTTRLNELPGLLTVTFELPASLQGKTISAIYRVHGGVVDTITKSGTEYFSQSGDTITLRVKKFSTYGLAYGSQTSSRSSGSGSSSDSSAIASPVTGTYWIELAEAKNMAKFSNDNKLDYARSRRATITGIRKNAAEALGILRYEHDTMLGKAVGVRVYIYQPAKLTADTLVSGYVEGYEVDRAKKLFDKWFKNNMRVVSMEQKDPWGQAVEIAARLDLSDMNVKNLCFYSYNPKTNSYSRITQPKYWIDINGYWHFTTELAGDIIVSDGELKKK